MIVPIRKMGDPCLLVKSAEVAQHEFGSAELLALIQDLHDTQLKQGGVGIAAPQIGINKRIVIIEYFQKYITRYSDIGDCPRRVIINPEISLLDGELTAFSEGCLSVPGLRGEVFRPRTIEYKFYDEYGNLHHGTDNSFFARVLQHECDHLDGILYPMRMNDISKLAFIDWDANIAN